MDPNLAKLRETDAYKNLIHERSKSKWFLAALMLIVYYGFILIIAFAPHIFAIPISSGVTSLGILSGLGIILFSFVITGIYVRKANNVLEPLTEQLHIEAEKLQK